jgi:hypothetical protein
MVQPSLSLDPSPHYTPTPALGLNSPTQTIRRSSLNSLENKNPKPSFLSRLKSTPHPRVLIPASIRRHRQQRNNRLIARQRGTEVLGSLIVRVLTCRGISNNLVSIRYDNDRAGPIVLTSLNEERNSSSVPVECKLECNVFADGSFGRNRIEVICMDSNEQYIGEVSLSSDDMFGEPETWISGPPIGFWDAENIVSFSIHSKSFGFLTLIQDVTHA